MSELPKIHPDDDRYHTNALRWIKFTAGMHALGGAFDPQHMQDLANFAADALAGEPMDDIDVAIERGKQRAKEWEEAFGWGK